MNTKKRNLIFISILAIIYVVYIICFFAIPFNRNISTFSNWISFGSTTFLFIICSLSTLLAINNKDLKSRIFGAPIIFLNIFTIILQVIYDLFVMVVGNFIEVQYWISIIFEALLFAIFFISLISNKSYKDKIEIVDKKATKEFFIRKLRVELEIIRNTISDETMLKSFDKLLDEVRYTNPVSSKEVYELEEEISTVISQLKKSINEGNYTMAKRLANKARNLIKERKMILAS